VAHAASTGFCSSELGAALLVAGVANAVEPVMEHLPSGTGTASLERGDMLVVLQKGGLVVTDVSVVHPVANSFIQRASKYHKYGAGGQVAGGSISPLFMWTYGCLGIPAMQVLGTLAASTAWLRCHSQVFYGGGHPRANLDKGRAWLWLIGNEVVYREALHVYATAGRHGHPWRGPL
jgi:hypothetical protein